MRDKNPDSPMSQHMEVCHGGREPHMEMTVMKMHRKALSRQIHEAVIISRSSADILLNNKSEWSKDKTPRVKVNTSKEEKKREEKEKVIEEKMRKIEDEGVNRDHEVVEQVQSEQHQDQQIVEEDRAKRKRDDDGESQVENPLKRARWRGSGCCGVRGQWDLLGTDTSNDNPRGRGEDQDKEPPLPLGLSFEVSVPNRSHWPLTPQQPDTLHLALFRGFSTWDSPSSSLFLLALSSSTICWSWCCSDCTCSTTSWSLLTPSSSIFLIFSSITFSFSSLFFSSLLVLTFTLGVLSLDHSDLLLSRISAELLLIITASCICLDRAFLCIFMTVISMWGSLPPWHTSMC
jgi:hypothetical protein